jgi:hypothetical protein
LRTIATELVDMSKKAVSGRMPSISPFSPSATCSTSAGTGKEVKTISLCLASQGRKRPPGRGGSSFAIKSVIKNKCLDQGQNA